MGAVGKADRGRGARHLLLRDDMLEIAEPEPAILLGDGDAVQAERAHFRPQLGREPVLLVDPRGERRDPVGGEAAGGVADRVGHLAEFEIEAEFGHVRVSCRRAALAERRRFEQARASAYVPHRSGELAKPNPSAWSEARQARPNGAEPP